MVDARGVYLLGLLRQWGGWEESVFVVVDVTARCPVSWRRERVGPGVERGDASRAHE